MTPPDPVQQEAERLQPAARIATTVARAMAERGDDVGPNVTLVLLATIDQWLERDAESILLADKLVAEIHRLAEGDDEYDWGRIRPLMKAYEESRPAPRAEQEER